MPTTRQHTFGLKRTESLSALFSMISLALVCVGLGYEAIHRLINPPEHLVNGKIMSGIALIGVLVNIALAFVLGEHHVHLPGAHSHGHGDHHDEEDHDHDHDHGHEGHGDHHYEEDHDDDHDHDHGHEGHEVHERPSQQQIGGVEMLPSYQKPNGDPHSHDHDHHDDQEKGHSHGHNDHDTTNNHDNGNDEEHCEVHTSEVPFNHETTDKRNINLRAAYLHVLGDLAQSVAVLIAGVIIWVRPDLHIIDPILTLLFAVLVLYSTFGVVRESIAVMLEATPPNISWEKVHEAIMKVPNVEDVHDLHIWSISHGQPILSVHCQSKDSDALGKIRDQCLTFGISHATIQVQYSEGSCLTCAGTMYCTRHLA
jgi:zinc transporter 2